MTGAAGPAIQLRPVGGMNRHALPGRLIEQGLNSPIPALALDPQPAHLFRFILQSGGDGVQPMNQFFGQGYDSFRRRRR